MILSIYSKKINKRYKKRKNLEYLQCKGLSEKTAILSSFSGRKKEEISPTLAAIELNYIHRRS
jgi:hypothetical protein